jgi:acyl-CoA reductase-like NAD-dependent aldehyde dehydrogenase
MRDLQKPSHPMAPRQLVIAFEQPQLWRMPVTERRKIVVSLANLLMEAAGDAAETEEEENGDDER